MMKILVNTTTTQESNQYLLRCRTANFVKLLPNLLSNSGSSLVSTPWPLNDFRSLLLSLICNETTSVHINDKESIKVNVNQSKWGNNHVLYFHGISCWPVKCIHNHLLSPSDTQINVVLPPEWILRRSGQCSRRRRWVSWHAKSRFIVRSRTGGQQYLRSLQDWWIGYRLIWEDKILARPSDCHRKSL